MSILHTKFRYLLIVFLLAVGAALARAQPARVRADVGIDTPTPGGLITPGQKTDSIKMKNERVVFQVQQGTGPFASAYQFDNTPETSRYYAHVTATFTMQNLTNSAVTQNLIFPFHLVMNQYDVVQAKNQRITVNGQAVNPTLDSNATFEAPFSAEHGTVAHFPATFAAKADTTIVVEYDLRAVPQPKSTNVAFEYMMQTGSHWADTIGHGEVIFDFGATKIDSTTPFLGAKAFKAEAGKLMWSFDNLEPAKANDISLSFSPYVLNTVWANRSQKFITGMTTGDGKEYLGSTCGNTRTTSTDCYTVHTKSGDEGVMAAFGNKSYLPYLLADPTDKNANGWLVPYRASTSVPFSEWVEFTFDGNYTFTGLQIRGGYLDVNPDMSNGYSDTPGTFYDSFRRPKSVTVTYADGSYETLALRDLPSELQTVAFTKNKASNKIRLTFDDTYPGTNYGNAYFGVGRVVFAGAQKVTTPTPKKKQTPAATPTTQPKQAESKSSNKNLPYIIGGGAAVVVAGGAAVAFAMARHAKSAAKIASSAASTVVPTEPQPEATPAAETSAPAEEAKPTEPEHKPHKKKS